MSDNMLTDYGFEWAAEGAATVTVTRTAILPEQQRVLEVNTRRHKVQLYITRTGLIRVFRDGQELKPRSLPETPR